MTTRCKCPTCGQAVEVHTADEGTSCYIGTERDHEKVGAGMNRAKCSKCKYGIKTYDANSEGHTGTYCNYEKCPLAIRDEALEEAAKLVSEYLIPQDMDNEDLDGLVDSIRDLRRYVMAGEFKSKKEG